MFDIEYIFLRLRGKSVGETVELSLLCPDDEKTYAKTKLNLEDVGVHMTADHTNEVNISDKVKVVFNYPLLKNMKDVTVDSSEMERMFGLLNKCIREIHFSDKIYNRVDMTDLEIDEFINSMNTEQLQDIIKFFIKVINIYN